MQACSWGFIAEILDNTQLIQIGMMKGLCKSLNCFNYIVDLTLTQLYCGLKWIHSGEIDKKKRIDPLIVSKNVT